MVKMNLLVGYLVLVMSLCQRAVRGIILPGYMYEQDKIEQEHYGYFPLPGYENYWYFRSTSTMTPWVDNKYQIAPKTLTPDFRLPEPMPTPKALGRLESSYKQFNRPYRFSSSAYIAWHYGEHPWVATSFFKPDEASSFACYCCTAYRLYTPLATCALLTTRHVLTTASSTERVLKAHGHLDKLDNILSVWYEMGYVTVNNASIYGTPARIHYHPWYTGLDKVNMSHPVPMYDLSVWALTYPTYAYSPYNFKFLRAIFCQRPASHLFYQTSPGLRSDEDYWVFGYQFIRAYNRKPNPYIKYGVRTRDIVYPCAKKEWGWYLCMGGRWAPLGVDSGAILHRTTRVRQRGWFEIPDMSGWKVWDTTSTQKPIVRVDGLVGMAAFSLNLRSNKLVHYFTVIETHPVLDFLYSAYMGRLPYAYLDKRFWNTQWGAPYPKPWCVHSTWNWQYPYPEYSAKLYYPGDTSLL